MYGEDGLDIAKAPFLKPEHLSFLDDNASVITNKEIVAKLQNDEADNEAILAQKKKV